MSGSSGGGGGGHNDESPCDKLRFEAQLTTPQPAVVATLKLKEVLVIDVATLKGQVVVRVLKKGKVAGGLAGPDATRLRNCIERDHTYKATVRTINGGQVRVLVEHT
jgi:hypothetical protein